MESVLSIQGVSKAFPGVQALSSVDLDAQAGDIHALVGENGAGKSTLVKILAGLFAPDEGEVRLAGEAVTHFDPNAAGRRGIAVVHQHIGLFPSLTGLENLFAGDLPTSAGGRVDWSRMRAEAAELLGDLGLEVDLGRAVGELSVAERQEIQIARALRRDARLLILDEPTASLGERECEALFELIERLRGDGLAIIYISHRLEEVFRLADRITVLRDGENVGTVLADEVTRPDIVAMMVGREVAEDTRPEPRAQTDEILLAVDGLTVEGSVEGVSFELERGEILGIAGLAGSGKEELVTALFGLERLAAGQISTPEGPARIGGPAAARKLGIAYVPGDRHGRGVITGMTVRENISLSILRQLSWLGFPSRRREDQLAKALATDLDVRAYSLEQSLATLSGGNQQKVAVARRLAAEPRVLVLEEPTQGVDIAARAAIHDLIRELAAQGVGVLLVSSDLPELLALSDRVITMREGRVAAVYASEEATPENVMEAALATDDGRDEEGAARTPAFRIPAREAGLAAALVVLALVLSLRIPAFAGAHNLQGVLLSSSHLAICAAGMTAVIVAGGIDVSIGAMLALNCMLMGMMLQAGRPVVEVCLVGMALATLMGALNGALSAWLRVPAIVATLGTRSIFRGAALKLNGGNWITDLPEDFERIGDAGPLGLPYPIIIAAACALVVAVYLGHFRGGRSAYAVGDDASAARAAGLRPKWTQFAAFTGLGFLVGIASILYAAMNPPIQPKAAPTLELVAITAVMVGGTNIFGGSGSVLGTILGVLLLGVIANALTLCKVDDYWAQALQGALILAAVTTDILRVRLARRRGSAKGGGGGG